MMRGLEVKQLRFSLSSIRKQPISLLNKMQTLRVDVEGGSGHVPPSFPLRLSYCPHHHSEIEETLLFKVLASAEYLLNLSLYTKYCTKYCSNPEVQYCILVLRAIFIHLNCQVSSRRLFPTFCLTTKNSLYYFFPKDLEIPTILHQMK